ncbi:MAG: hypothetical protein U1F50_14655 [Rubrivivax sp.]
MMRTSVALAGATLVGAMLMVGCGQKGPLTLPAPPANAASAPAR